LKKPEYRKVELAVAKLLSSLNFDWQNDPNMIDTPARVGRMLIDEVYAGCYTEEPKFTAFPNDRKYNQLVISRKIQFYSTCSHHLKDFYGYACIGIMPSDEGKLPGYSKYARTVEYFARRPQLQENLTELVADFLEEKVAPRGIGVHIRARHLCACARGVHQQEGEMVTLALRGELRNNPSMKAEFLAECSNKE
jgi:GTP cyclohydrolase I